MTSGDTHSRKLYSAPNSLNSHPPVFAEDLASWQRSLRAQRKSQKTIETYMHGMSSFLRWCAKNGEDPRLDHVLIQRWISDLLVNREATTARTYQHSVVAFGNWMVAEGEIDTNPLARGKLPRLDAKIVQPLTDQQLQALFNACKGREFIDLRDLAALRLLADTAVRASELLGFNREHLDLDACTGTVICGKGGKGRMVAFSQETAAAVDRYLRACTRRGQEGPHVFVTVYGDKMVYTALRSALLRRAEAAGVKGFHPHLLRHTAASTWLDRGGSEGGLMAIGGWANRSMMDRYTKHSASTRALNEARALFGDN